MSLNLSLLSDAFYHFFPEDKQLVLLDEDLVLLGDYAQLSLDEWKAMPVDTQCSVQAYYENSLYDGVIIQAVSEDCEAVEEQVRMMRCLIEKKNYREQHLLRRCKSRYRQGRSRFPPMDLDHKRFHIN